MPTTGIELISMVNVAVYHIILKKSLAFKPDL